MGKPIASDGGSSSYYDIEIPKWLLAKLVDRDVDGKCYIKTEELIEAGFGNDFDAGNVLKSFIRAWGAFNGAGKEGNSLSYEFNKIRYSLDKLHSRKERQVGD